MRPLDFTPYPVPFLGSFIILSSGVEQFLPHLPFAQLLG